MQPTEAAAYAELGIRLVNAYGTAECLVNATIEPGIKPGTNPNRVSYPTGTVIWPIDDDDLEKGPIGPRVEGEVLLEGRREGQVKIQGQRVKLAEIEQYLQDAFPRTAEVVVEKVTTEWDKRDSLVAFVQLDEQKTTNLQSHHDTSSDPSLFLPADSASIQMFATAQSELQDHLPKYMIPSVFIHVVSIPRTSLGKVNRSMLRATAARLSREELQKFAGRPTQSRPPATAVEFKLQQIYADVLNLPLSKIGMNDTFLQLGGDSILAVHLLGAARKAGLALDVSDVLGPTRLDGQAKKAAAGTITTPETSIIPSKYVRFSALGSEFYEEAPHIAQQQCGVSRDSIEDMYPCTPLQEAMFAVSMSQPGMYSDRIVFEVPKFACQLRLRAAWEETVHATPILRTRIIQTPDGLLQVVLQELSNIWWDDAKELPNRPGAPLMRCLLTGGTLTLTIHHAVWDAWTMKLVHDRLERAFQGGPRLEPVTRLFHPFIQYLQKIHSDSQDAFWREQLAGHKSAIFLSLPSAQYQPSPSAMWQHTMNKIHMTARSHTLATYIHLVWALVVAQYTDSAEAIYGLTVSGRSAPLESIGDIAGPTIATVPMRVNVRSEDTVPVVLDQIHSRIIGMIPYEQAGLQRIAKTSADAARACQFQSHLNIQVAPPNEKSDRLFPLVHGTPGRGMDLTRFSNYALNLLLQLSGDGSTVTVQVAYDAHILSAGEVTRILH
ncbi:condensation domain-containing protein [Aspergillus carlsbadensis]|nr:condensation domain-containing protein [Aspergillus carlsbadensis]